MGDENPGGDPQTKPKIQGEGDHEAARRFDAEERAFVEPGGIEPRAREAEQALDGPEGEELERARVQTGEGRTGRDDDEVSPPPRP